MKTEEFIERIKGESRVFVEKTDELRASIPLGEYSDGAYALSHRDGADERYRHTCVTGAMRAEFISRILLTLTGLYSNSEAVFIVVSPNMYYGQFMKLKSVDVTIPFITTARDIPPVLEAVRAIAEMRKAKPSKTKTFLVLDGIETVLPEEERFKLDCYRPFFDAATGSGIEIITGVDLSKSVFAGYPSVFVGIGNCLVAPSVGGEMDVTYVEADGSMSVPKKCEYPSLPTITECIERRNAEQYAG